MQALISTPSKTDELIYRGVKTLQITEVRLLQPKKVPYPILVTLLGIVMDVRLLQ